MSPFSNYDFYAYCQALPYQFKNQKAILRRYYQAKKYPALWYDLSLPNEEFSGFVDNALLSDGYQQLMRYFGAHSQLARAEYVDVQIISHTYGQAQMGDCKARAALYSIYVWLNIELNLYIAQNSGQWVDDLG